MRGPNPKNNLRLSGITPIGIQKQMVNCFVSGKIISLRYYTSIKVGVTSHILLRRYLRRRWNCELESNNEFRMGLKIGFEFNWMVISTKKDRYYRLLLASHWPKNGIISLSIKFHNEANWFLLKRYRNLPNMHSVFVTRKVSFTKPKFKNNLLTKLYEYLNLQENLNMLPIWELIKGKPTPRNKWTKSVIKA